MTNISVSIDDELVQWLDQLIQNGTIASRSEAIREAIFEYIKHQLGLKDRKMLREFLRKQQNQDFESGTEVIRQVRREK